MRSGLLCAVQMDRMDCWNPTVNWEISVKVCSAPLSALARTITGSSTFLTTTSIGQFPSSITAAFRTVPPCSMQYGGVSLQPPPQFTDWEIYGHLIFAHLCIRIITKALTAPARIPLLMVAKQESIYFSSKQDRT